MERIKVVYIGGSGRCGSTLLSLILGEQPGYVDCGELKYIWERGLEQNRKCGCGQEFLECSYWDSVIEKVKADVGSESIVHMQEIIDRLTRYKNFLNLEKNMVSFDGIEKNFVDNISVLYRSIYKTSGRKIIIDASKLPSYALLLSSIRSIDVYFVHLVRDPHAVAYSWKRKKKYEPGSNIDMDRFGAFRSSIMWKLSDLTAERIKKRVPSSTVRYEDIINRKSGELSRLLEEISAWSGSPCNDVFNDNELEISSVHHTVSGNPIRFGSNNITLKSDNEWVDNISFFDKKIIGCIAKKEIKKYKY